ncbi:MAG: SDR family oxidoreductase [Devosiaceae bacterium]|nr:SDR family oxidoreductase [Devosiaceae bacterium MH13]
MKRYLLVGGSSGIGAAYAAHLVARGDQVLSVSRRPAPYGTWVQADISSDQGIDTVGDAVGEEALDGLLYLGGTWENGAFTDAYSFGASPRSETRNVISVNLIAPILLSQALAPSLAKASNPRIIFIGALSGLDRSATVEVANTASKFGLRGAAQALTLALRDQGIGVSVINPGNVATPEVQDDIASGAFGDQLPIPLPDLFAAIDFLLNVSKDSAPEEITLAQKHPES